jgi:hypothetical protein
MPVWMVCPVTVECVQCKAAIQTMILPRRFCGPKCYGAFLHQLYADRWKESECKNCHKAFVHRKLVMRTYCSMKCLHASQSTPERKDLKCLANKLKLARKLTMAKAREKP